MERNLLQELKVGIFVFGLLAAILIALYILGGSDKMFAEEYQLHTSFSDVKGLKTGAVVRLAGIDVGQVSKVAFAADPGVKRVEIELTIREEYQSRIRSDSVATISQVGLLGDMFITLTVGDPSVPPLGDEDTIKSAESTDLIAYAEKATGIVESAASISRKVDLMLGTDEEAKNARIADSLAHIETLLTDAKNEQGVVHTLIYDPEAGEHLKGILASVDGITGDVASVTREVRSGDGIVHALVYGEGGEQLATQMTEAAGAMTTLLADVKKEDSLVHALLYDADKATMVDDLQATLADVRGAAGAVNDTEGTVGLLLHDPQLYEDVRALMGGAQRSALLRAYLRATVAKGKEETAAGWTPPEGK